MSFLKAFRHKIFFGAAAWMFAATMQPAHAQPIVTVEVSSQQPGHAIVADFVGLSFEMQRVLPDTNGSHFFSPENKQLIATFKTLGIKSLRVGGNTADRPTLPVPDKADIDQLFTFAKAADVKVIYTLRLNHGDPATATEAANYISRHYASQLDCFAIGNEPNVFSTNFDVYFTEWKHYAAQISAPSNSPDAKFCGPSVSPGHEKWSAQFARTLASSGLLKYISQHDYPGGDARKVTNPETARDRILSPTMDAHYAKFAANFVPAVISNGLACRFEEANSFYDGGALDVSDTFASALWALNYQWWLAANRISGINFHTGDKVAARDENKPCRYAVFWTSPHGYSVHPIGYALKMFSLGGQGRLLTTKVENPENLNVAAYAAATDSNNLCITLINREHGSQGQAVEFILKPGFAKATAEAMLLNSPEGDIAAKTGIALGGAEIQDDATWTGKWTPLPKPAMDGKFNLKLPPASAALVKITASTP